jgi:hypothetical protein
MSSCRLEFPCNCNSSFANSKYANRNCEQMPQTNREYGTFLMSICQSKRLLSQSSRHIPGKNLIAVRMALRIPCLTNSLPIGPRQMSRNLWRLLSTRRRSQHFKPESRSNYSSSSHQAWIREIAKDVEASRRRKNWTNLKVRSKKCVEKDSIELHENTAPFATRDNGATKAEVPDPTIATARHPPMLSESALSRLPDWHTHERT